MPSGRFATLAVGALLSATVAACTLDRSGLDPDAARPPSGTDAANDQPPDVASDGLLDLDAPLPDDANQAPDTGDALAAEAGADGGPEVADDTAGETAGPDPALVGCADGTREGLLDLAIYPAIAACDGGWQIPGLTSVAARAPACLRGAGNGGSHPDGLGCSTADLCAAGWHVCASTAEVKQKGGQCADAVLPSNGRKIFYATRQTNDPNCNSNGNGNGNGNSGSSGEPAIHGCGNIGPTDDASCVSDGRLLRADQCAANPPWQCAAGATPSPNTPPDVVTKPGSTVGGVLCCRD